jgi:hypothetical protein
LKPIPIEVQVPGCTSLCHCLLNKKQITSLEK